MPKASEVMVIDTVEKIVPGVVEVDEYIVQADDHTGEELSGAAPGMPAGIEEE
jgi:hypothetical protein